MSEMLQFSGALVLGFLGPYILAVYAAIYSNAIPDWFSVALTRSLLFRASRTTRLADFLRFLFYDLLCVVALCFLTAIILILAFTVSGILVTIAIVSWSESSLPTFLSSDQLEKSAHFFYGGLAGLIELIGVLFGQWNWDVIDSCHIPEGGRAVS
jgi:hypothetical protein